MDWETNSEKKTLGDRFGDWFLENQIGIYTTTIIHLIIFLGLTINTIHSKMNPEVLVVNFLQEEDIKTEEDLLKEQEDKLLDEKKRLEEEVAQMLNDNSRKISVPNRVVNLGAASQSSEEGSGESGDGLGAIGERSENSESGGAIARKSDTKPADKDNQSEPTMAASGGKGGKEGATATKGPSIVSYKVEGRTAVYLPIPAYMCKEGGDVTILIEVNRYGHVTNSSVDSKTSSKNSCLHDAALTAANKSRFTSDPNGGTASGFIIYRFMAQ